MAENTTKDIWNDDDGEREEPQKKRHLLRNFLIFLLVLILVLGIVLVAAWRDGTGLDALRRYFAYGSSAAASRMGAKRRSAREVRPASPLANHIAYRSAGRQSS